MTRYTIKKPEKRVLIFLILLCVGLLLLILYVQGEIKGLQNLIAKLTQSDEAQIEKQQTIEEMPYTMNLRIAVTNAAGSVYWEQVDISSDNGLKVSEQGQEVIVPSGEKFSYVGEAKVRLADAAGGQLHITGREQGYAGVLEVCTTPQGVMVVNEIHMEEYLKRVVPSEMPRTYGLEALKAQAVCARTYAYSHSNSYAYPEAMAHMDDTVSFQVYNNCGETQETNQAIAETAGEVLVKGETIVPTLYYSTSCGYIQDGTLFGEGMDLDVYVSKYSGLEEPKQDFESYIRSGDLAAYESGERYFRWRAQISNTSLESMRTYLGELLQKEGAVTCNKKMKRCLTDTSKNAKETLKELKEIKVCRRNPGGAAMEAELIFATGKVKVTGELNIRKAIGSEMMALTLQNNEVISQAVSLPSAAFSVEKQPDGTFVLYGGGYGHGTGMSQNGAKALCGIGYTYGDILQYYYENTTTKKM